MTVFSQFTTQSGRSPAHFNSTDLDLQELIESSLGPRHKDIFESVFLTFVYSAIFISGVIGNVCTGVIVARRPDMRTTTNFYLCSLAVSDIITLIVGLPIEMYQIWEAYPWIFGQAYCIMKTFFLDMTSSASVLTITAFTVERYFAIRYPLVAHTSSDANLRRVPGVILLVWIAAAIIAIPYPTHMTVDYEIINPFTQEYVPESLVCNIEKQWREFYKRILLFSFICLFVVPITVITILYILIAITIRRSARARSFNRRVNSTPNNQHSSNSNQSHKAVLKMLVAVVVAFFVCWAPFHAQRLMSSYIHNWTTFLIAIHNGLFYVSGILYYFACTVNPILYNLMSRKYRRAFKETLCRSCWKSANRRDVQRTSALYRTTNHSSLLRCSTSTNKDVQPLKMNSYNVLNQNLTAFSSKN